jgi:predicted nucleic-acid-binding protein
MTGIDTNILVRIFVSDDVRQTAIAQRFMETLTPEEPGYISTVALMELWWVLHRTYQMEKMALVRAVRRLLDAPHLLIEHKEEVSEAVGNFLTGNANLQDYLVERRCFGAGCARTMTFDRAAARSAGMTLVDQIPIASPAPNSVSTPSTAKMAAAIP